MVSSRPANPLDEILKSTPPALVAFIANLPAVEDVDVVLSICLQSNVSTGQTRLSTQLAAGPVPSTSDLSGSSKSHPIPSGSSFKPMRDRQPGKRKDLDRQEDDETATAQSLPLPRDVFKIRQIWKARGGTTSQTGSASYGSAFSGELSGSTG
ncbi:cleavage stimulation factor subunit 77-like isoform X2 [Vitis riparia]|uniref:cleavage stimulation factor subunit 77-like isoform X2 n=1 Tax=Vitis riparia TaxID=96939 RepID=UPI00155ABFD2|nr:cleavage stimulation factor subunit 77-like isoform X2 [Vitis riparia]